MQRLVLHPDCKAGPVTAITAAIEPTDSWCRATFIVTGDMARIAIPAKAQPGRTDNLWKTTCFEIFWGSADAAYREFNLSPSTRWACYEFDGYRLNSRDCAAEVAITLHKHDTRMELKAEITSDLPLPAKAALTAIIEDTDGNIQYWSLAFPPGKPDFHSNTCRALTLAEKST